MMRMILLMISNVKPFSSMVAYDNNVLTVRTLQYTIRRRFFWGLGRRVEMKFHKNGHVASVTARQANVHFEVGSLVSLMSKTTRFKEMVRYGFSN